MAEEIIEGTTGTDQAKDQINVTNIKERRRKRSTVAGTNKSENINFRMSEEETDMLFEQSTSVKLAMSTYVGFVMSKVIVGENPIPALVAMGVKFPKVAVNQ